VLPKSSRRQIRGVAAPSAAQTRLASIPLWAWLAGIVLMSVWVQIAIGRGIQSPTVFFDELAYWELSRSFSESGHFLLRDAPTTVYGPLSRLYPILIAPAFKLSGNSPQAFAFVKAINAVLMSLAAVPTYFVARRLLSKNFALIAAILAVAVPSIVYSGMVMTESAAYPAFLLCALAMIASLEEPKARRQLAVLATIGLAFAIRAQAVVVLPAYLTAIVLLAWLETKSGTRSRDLRRNLAPYKPTWFAVAGGLAFALAFEGGRGHSPIALFGSYGVVAGGMELGSVPQWFLYHLADLDLYVGVVPLAAFCVLVAGALSAGASRRLRVFAAVAVSLLVWMMLQVAVFSSSVWGLGRLHERNLFYVVPLILIGFLAFFEIEGVRDRRLVLGAAIATSALPAMLPFAQLWKGARVDSLALVPWGNTLISAGAVPLAMTVFAALLSAFVFAPRHLMPILICVVAVNFLVLGSVANSQLRGSARLLADVRVDQTWIDDAVGPTEKVAAVWFPNRIACVPFSRDRWYKRELALWENEFFNRSLTTVYYVGAPFDSFPSGRLVVDPATGALIPVGLKAFAPRYLLVGQEVRLDAPIVARNRQTRSVLYRVRGSARVIAPRNCGAFAGSRVFG
jgi:4-amino-4-deoxy-L-arabinose transferase-like glycosyltransferase